MGRLWRIKAEHAEERGAMGVEPVDRGVAELARDHAGIEGGELVEADHRGNLEAGAGKAR